MLSFLQCPTKLQQVQQRKVRKVNSLSAVLILDILLGVIIDYEVHFLGELWKMKSVEEPRCQEDNALNLCKGSLLKARED